ncbi:MAG: hypothetical protein ABIV06_08945 [Thermoanaerobaculia bacterium]
MSRRNPSQQPRPAWLRLLWLASGVAVLALASVELRHRSVAVGGGTARDAPTWIWRDHDLRHVQSAGFYAVKEFDLSAAPADAEVRILGDGEYLLMLNGVRIGSNRFVSGAPIDLYRVERWLQPGRNRLVVELRSSSGAGGLWFELRSGGQQLARTDGSWTIYDSNWRGLFGGRPMPPGERPRLLGRSPLGRWGAPPSGPVRPAFEDALAAAEPLPAELYRIFGADQPWQPFAGRGRRPPSFGPLVQFDFGAERSGYLQLSYREGPRRHAEPSPGAVLLAFSDQPIGEPPWTAQTLFQPIFGSGLYQDATVRRFRYVAVAGLPGIFSAEVLATTAEASLALAPRAAAAGILGVEPPPSSAPVEHEVWRKLESAAGVAVRKER